MLLKDQNFWSYGEQFGIAICPETLGTNNLILVLSRGLRFITSFLLGEDIQERNILR